MALSEAEPLLHTALQNYFTAVAAQKSPAAPALTIHFNKLDALESQLASQLDPRLRHFLESKSYRKAHDYLESALSSKLVNPTPPRQTCTR
ncbi:MAG: hypothetical protein NTZ01_03270 [Verrucomicrobia bacterium]|nr:hypothetical protein [Verrucomicrobiota bacterium]